MAFSKQITEEAFGLSRDVGGEEVARHLVAVLRRIALVDVVDPLDVNGRVAVVDGVLLADGGTRLREVVVAHVRRPCAATSRRVVHRFSRVTFMVKGAVFTPFC